MSNRNLEISQFVCPDCGLIMPLPRRHGKERETGHIKDLFCPRCGKIEKMLEYKSNQPIRNGLGETIEYEGIN